MYYERADGTRVPSFVIMLQIVLSIYMLYSGWSLFGSASVPVFEEIGFGQWLRFVTGVLEIAGAVGLLLQRLCGLAALGLMFVMLGAMFTEMLLLAKGSPLLPAVLTVLFAVIAYVRRDTIVALLGQGDQGA